jgi:AcrR family transcriptional regulator
MSERPLDVRAKRSRSQLIGALRVQLHERDPREITVSSVCTEAGLSRPTFYQHFASLDELAVAGIEQRLAELDPGAPTDARPTSYEAVVRFLDELASDRGVYRQVIGSDAIFSGPRDAVEDWLVVRLIEDHDGPVEDPSSIRFAAGGILSLVRGWLLQEPDDRDRPTSKELADDLWRLASLVVGGTGPPDHALG